MDAKSSLPAVKLSGADKGMRMLYKGYNTSSGSQGSVFKDWSAEVFAEICVGTSAGLRSTNSCLIFHAIECS